MDRHENFTTDMSVDKENWLNFGSHPYPDLDPGFFKDSTTLRDGAFFYNLAPISGETEQIFMKVLSQVYPWNSPLNFGSIRIWSPNPDFVYILWIWTRFALAEVCNALSNCSFC